MRPRTILLLLWVALWVGVLQYFTGSRWLPWFAEGEIAISPSAQLKKLRVSPNGTLRLPAMDQGGAFFLGTLTLEGEGDWLLTFDAPPGPEYTLQICPEDTWSPLRELEIPSRPSARSFVFVLRSVNLEERVRLRIRHRYPAPLRVAEPVVRHLNPGHRLVLPLVFVLGLVGFGGFAWWNRHALGEYLHQRPLREERLGPGRGRGDRLAALLLFVLCFLVYRHSPVNQLYDYKHITVVSHQLLHHGTLALPQSNLAKHDRFIAAKGRAWHLFPSAPAVLNLPFVYAFEKLGVVPVSVDGRLLPLNERRILRACAAAIAAGLCVVLLYLGRIWLGPLQALPLVGVFGFGTQIYSTISRPYWSHAWATLLLAGALLLLFLPRLEHHAWGYAGSATLLSWSFFCRPTMSLAVLGLTVFVVLYRRRFLPWWVGAGALWFVLFIGHSVVLYGAPLPPYYYSAHLETGRFSSGVLAYSYPEAVLGTLLSPGRGLLIFVPVYGVILFAVLRRWRSLPCRALTLVALGVILAHWQLISLFRNWWGGQSFGPRLFSDLVPWFFVLAVFALAACLREVRDGGPSLKPWSRLVVVLLIAASIFIHTRGATARATIQWEGKEFATGFVFPPPSKTFTQTRLWNWSYPQFLAGL